MKICKFCLNAIPTEHKNKIACCTSPCPSSLIKPRTLEWKIKVLGLDEEQVLLKNKERTTKAGITRKNLGLSKGINNPNSKAHLLKSGLSLEAINEKHQSTATKSTSTKKDRNFYNDKSNNPYSVDFWTKRGLSIDEARHKIKSKNHNCPEYWISRGYDDAQSKILSRKSADTNSLNSKIDRYGEDGIEKYDQMRAKMSSSWSIASTNNAYFSSSKAANTFFKKLYRRCRRLGFTRGEMTFKLNYGKEFWLRSEKNIYFYDFVLHPLRIIIEFNGEHVHVSPNLSFTERENWKHAFSKKSALEIENYDAEKKKTALNNDYTILYVWSKTANHDFLTIINILKDTLNDETYCKT